MIRMSRGRIYQPTSIDMWTEWQFSLFHSSLNIYSQLKLFSTIATGRNSLLFLSSFIVHNLFWDLKKNSKYILHLD